jgi:hypothetical protein
VSEDYEHVFYLSAPGPRPPYGEVVDHVYGIGSNVDTEGDSYPAQSTEWTELYMQLRPPLDDLHRKNPLVQVWMDEDKKVMCVGSDDEALAVRTATYLADRTGATMTSEPPAA